MASGFCRQRRWTNNSEAKRALLPALRPLIGLFGGRMAGNRQVRDARIGKRAWLAECVGMGNWIRSILVLAAVLGGTMAAVSQEPVPIIADPIEGIWRTLLLSEVTIAPCPEGWCGTLSKIVVPTEGLTPEEIAAAQSMPVESFTDARNKDPELRNRPMLGLQIVTLRPGSKPGIYDGEVYNPQDGNIYSGYMEMLGPDAVRLNGCVLFNVICQGEDWVRVIPEPEVEASQ
ncbi:DUF2147 domain-containing protein [Devosia lacusdianchii]|uniref:DUF2147 domain-containing protein n=1 Tax=Devosia lacusdianchii TaxID=2917991 RepID=UPI001F06AB0C|nr:DUF2147 domain-containing protein [Devosia sp. JXJ CY 41]